MSAVQVLPPPGLPGAFLAPPPRPWLSIYGGFLKPPLPDYLQVSWGHGWGLGARGGGLAPGLDASPACYGSAEVPIRGMGV
jgi:hypothetical protein